jgi:hypothetical protein
MYVCMYVCMYVSVADLGAPRIPGVDGNV